MSLFTGFDTINTEETGYPVDHQSGYVANAFVVLGWIVLTWNVRVKCHDMA